MVALLLAIVVLVGGSYVAWRMVRRARDRSFYYSAEARRIPEEVVAEGTQRLLELTGAGYVVTEQGATGTTLTRSVRPWWLICPIVLFFPIGLLFLIYKQVDTVTLTVTPRGPFANVTATGVGPRELHSASGDLIQALATPRSN